MGGNGRKGCKRQPGADGTQLGAAAYYGAIYISKDSGPTWTPGNAPSSDWTSVASSADGTRWAATAARDANGNPAPMEPNWELLLTTARFTFQRIPDPLGRQATPPAVIGLRSPLRPMEPDGRQRPQGMQTATRRRWNPIGSCCLLRRDLHFKGFRTHLDARQRPQQ